MFKEQKGVHDHSKKAQAMMVVRKFNPTFETA